MSTMFWGGRLYEVGEYKLKAVVTEHFVMSDRISV